MRSKWWPFFNALGVKFGKMFEPRIPNNQKYPNFDHIQSLMTVNSLLNNIISLPAKSYFNTSRLGQTLKRPCLCFLETWGSIRARLVSPSIGSRLRDLFTCNLLPAFLTLHGGPTTAATKNMDSRSLQIFKLEG